MLFFQLLLLAGYGYAHVIVTLLSVKRQAIVHCCLLLLALAALPITPDPSFKPIDADLPILRILMILAFTVGIPYLLLSASGPLLQNGLRICYQVGHPIGFTRYRIPGHCSGFCPIHFCLNVSCRCSNNPFSGLSSMSFSRWSVVPVRGL